MELAQLEHFSPFDWFYDGRDQLKRHIYERSERAFASGAKARESLSAIEEILERQKRIRELFLKSIGGLPSSLSPLEPQITGCVEGEGFRVEKIIFQSRSRNYVTANLYLPDDLTEPRGAVLFLCGHHQQAKHHNEYQIVCQYLVKAGLITLAQDPIGQGERLGYFEQEIGGSTIESGTNEHDHAGAQCLPLGDSLARYFLHDAMRGVDYLCSRPEVDPERIGVTGNSGGGTQTSLMMLVDRRIAAAAPATFITSRQSYLYAGGAQDAEQIWPGFTSSGFDHEDILLSMAPRPVRVLAVKGDFFPIEGTRRTVENCKKIWEIFGCESRLDLVEDDSNHCYTRKLARSAAEFFAEHLLGEKTEIVEESIQPFEPQQLWCTASGQVRGELPGAFSVYEANQKRLQECKSIRTSVSSVERNLLAKDWLRNRVMNHRKPAELNPRFLMSGRWEDMNVESALWRAQEGIFNFGVLFRSFRFTGKALPPSLALWDGGTSSLSPHQDWIRSTCNKGRAVLVLDVTGVGPLAPNPLSRNDPLEFCGVIHKMATDLLWLDDDLAALRTYDTLRALDMLERWPGVDASDIQVHSQGRHGMYGRLAAALDLRMRSVELTRPFQGYEALVASRHYDTRDIHSILLHGALRFFDIDELYAELNGCEVIK